MRQLTAFASYHDNLGELLVGRVRFYNHPDGSPAEVFGLDNAHQTFISLGNTVFTNSSGQLSPQVFLANHDYLLVFDKYIGGGTMAEDDDPESWEEQGSAIDQYNTIGITLEGSSVRSSGTIDGLRQLPALTDDEIVLLLGYNTPGDKPAIYYKYNKNSTTQDNRGSVIAIEGQARGRWEIVECPRYLDVRHFGAFPNSGSVEDVNQRYAIQRAGNYAHENNCGLYFWGDSRKIYYDITGLDLFDVDSDANASIFAVKSSDPQERDAIRATIRGIKSVLCATDQYTTLANQGRIELIDETLKTSYGPAYRVLLTASKKIIVDSDCPTTSAFQGVEVDVLVDTGGKSFTNCLIHSAGHLQDTNLFAGINGTIRLTESMFTGNCNWNAIRLTGTVVVCLEDFSSVAAWCSLIKQLGVFDLDLEGRELTSECFIGHPDDHVTYRNAKFNGYSIPHQATLIHCSGGVIFTPDATLNIKDSTMSIVSLASGTLLTLRESVILPLESFSVASLYAYRSRIGFNGQHTITVSNAATIQHTEIATSVFCDSLNVSFCDIQSCSVCGHTSVVAEGCTFQNAHVIAESWRNSTAEDYNRLNAAIIGNRFLGTSKFKVAPRHTGVAVYKYQVDIKICGNFATTDFFDDSAFSSESNHSVQNADFSFVYNGNYGGCPVTEAEWTDVSAYVLQRLSGDLSTDPRTIPSHTKNVLYLYWDWRGSGDQGKTKRQFWWLFDINKTIDIDTYNLFRVKNLKIQTSFVFSFECTGQVYAQTYGTSVNCIPGLHIPRGIPVGTHTTAIQETLTHQMESDTIFGDGDLDERRSRLTKIVSNRIGDTITDGAEITWRIKFFHFLPQT